MTDWHKWRFDDLVAMYKDEWTETEYHNWVKLAQDIGYEKASNMIVYGQETAPETDVPKKRRWRDDL